ncbi:hypothetical protein LCGC14_2754430, partial [marine sediment metagenome]
QLLVTGTDQAETITLSQSVGGIALTTSAGTQQFDGAFTSVVVYGFGGDDVIRLTHSVAAAAWIYAGMGDDSVFEAGTGAAVVFGEAGDDLLVSVGGGADALYGGEGLDSFWADSADTVGDPSAAEATARSVHQFAEFYQPFSGKKSNPDYVPLEIDGQDIADPTITSAATRYDNFADRSLFVDGPQYDDISQGGIGDCYYMATLSSLADSDPHILEQMITPLGDGTFAMRFYRNNKEVYLRLDADLPVRGDGSLAYADFGPDGELWVPLAEKAYAYFRYDQNSYASLSGGWMTVTNEEITGMPSGFTWTSGSTNAIYTVISRALAAGQAVSLGTYYNASGPIVGSHAYTVRSVENTADGKFVTVYNVWGVDGRVWDLEPDDGLLRLTIHEIQDYFIAVVTSTA